VWDFGFIYNHEVSTKPRVVELFLQNAGGTNLEWYFKDDDDLFSDRKDSQTKATTSKQLLNSGKEDTNKEEFTNVSILEQKRQFFSFKPK